MPSLFQSPTFRSLSLQNGGLTSTPQLLARESLAHGWKARRPILQVQDSDDDSDGDEEEEYLAAADDDDVNSRNEDDDAINQDMCFVSPFKLRRGILCTQADGGVEESSQSSPDGIQEQTTQQQLSPDAQSSVDEESSQSSPWGNKCKAKQNIWKELDDPQSSIHLMTVEQIHKKWASAYPWKRFKKNFEAMKTQKRVYSQDDDEIEPWKTRSSTSKAYYLLFKLFFERDKTRVHKMTDEEIWGSHECFKQYDIADFKTYVRDVEKRTTALRLLVEEEEAAFRAFRSKYPRNELTNKGVPFWDDHPAKALLEKDVEDGTASRLKPKKLWSTRPEYKPFTLKIFTQHYYQEMRKQLAAPYWQYKRNISAMKEHQQDIENKKNEWHENTLPDMFGGLSLDDESDEEADQEQYRKSLSDKTVNELKDILREKGLRVSGKKQVLVERILNSDNS